MDRLECAKQHGHRTLFFGSLHVSPPKWLKPTEERLPETRRAENPQCFGQSLPSRNAFSSTIIEVGRKMKSSCWGAPKKLNPTESPGESSLAVNLVTWTFLGALAKRPGLKLCPFFIKFPESTSRQRQKGVGHLPGRSKRSPPFGTLTQNGPRGN